MSNISLFNGELASDGSQLQLLPPPYIVKEAAQLLEDGSTILDVGAYNGTSGFYLTGLNRGHEVDSLEINSSFRADGRKIRKALGGTALRNHFIPGDISSYPSTKVYDAVIATSVLQDMPKQVSLNTIEKLKNFAKPGGLNIVKAYIGTPEQKIDFPHLTLFDPGELEDLYKRSGWQIISYEERMKPIRTFRNPLNGSTEVRFGSSSEMIARKKQTASLKTAYLSQANAIQAQNPELAKHLRSQADKMD